MMSIKKIQLPISPLTHFYTQQLEITILNIWYRNLGHVVRNAPVIIHFHHGNFTSTVFPTNSVKAKTVVHWLFVFEELNLTYTFDLFAVMARLAVGIGEPGSLLYIGGQPRLPCVNTSSYFRV